MRESDIVRAIRERVARVFGPRAAVLKIHGSAFQSFSVDLVGVVGGQCFAIEVKIPGKHATPRQLAFLAQWAAAGARTGVATSADEALEIITGLDAKIADGVGSP